jgi:hypothetical protein
MPSRNYLSLLSVDVTQLNFMGIFKRVTAIVVMACFAHTAFSQENILFQDDFDDNKNNWKVISDANFLVKVDNGVLHMQKYEKNFIRRGCVWYSKEIPGFNTCTDFSITFYGKVLSDGDLFNLIDFQWGFRNYAGSNINGMDSMYQVGFIMEGRVHLNYFDKKWNYLHRINLPDTAKKIIVATPIPKTEDFAFPYKKNAFNQFEIIQKGDNCIIKVNGFEVLNKRMRPIYGNSIGIQQCLKSAWVMDKIIIKQDNFY